jgi:hypothetical protein
VGFEEFSGEFLPPHGHGCSGGLEAQAAFGAI